MSFTNTRMDQIEMLRTQLETSLQLPTILVISSARKDDGKGLVAAGLARSMEAAGYSTLLVLADEQTTAGQGLTEPKSLAEISDLGIARFVRASRSSENMMAIPSNNFRQKVSRDAVARFCETCRASYEVTVVDAGPVLRSAFAMLLSAAGDGVLIVIRDGRRVCADDRQLAKMLASEKTPFLGVVSVAASAINDERRLQIAKHPTTGTTKTANVKAGGKRHAV